MTKQLITESELASRVNSLKEKMANEAWYNPATWGGATTGGGAATGNPKIAAQGAKAGATGAASTTPVKPPAPAAKPDPNVMALQQKLIAAGAKIKADGIMGPATRAAQQQFPQVTTQTDAEKAAAADINSADQAAPAPAAGPATGADMDAATADASAQPAAAPAAAPAPTAAAPAPAQGGLVDGSGNPVKDGSGQQVKTGVAESAYNELQRMMSIVQYR